MELNWKGVNEEMAKKGYRGETHKAHERRLKEGWYDKYCPHKKTGIDIGCGYDVVHATFRRWDIVYKDGDATKMVSWPPLVDGVFNTVYSSHLLEHIKQPVIAVSRWYQLVAPGGHLVICVPHRDLYEKKVRLPSNWNQDHKWFWLPDKTEMPHTKSLKGTIEDCIPNADIVSLRVLNEDYNPNGGPESHASGEYSIEIIVRKPE